METLAKEVLGSQQIPAARSEASQEAIDNFIKSRQIPTTLKLQEFTCCICLEANHPAVMVCEGAAKVPHFLCRTCLELFLDAKAKSAAVCPVCQQPLRIHI